MATINDIVERVRSHPAVADNAVGKIADDNFAFAVTQMIFPCLEELSGRIAGTAARVYGFTDPTTITATLDGDGAADLLTLSNEQGLMLDTMGNGEIRHPDSPYPLVPIAHSGEGALPSNYSGLGFIRYWMVGSFIHTLSIDNNTTPLTGDLSFACPRGLGLDDLAVDLEGRLVDMLVERLRRSPLKESLPK